MTGRRLPDGFEPTREWYERLGISELPKGGYGKDSSDTWCVVTPNGRYGSLANHTVVEHEDTTITVAPSILVPAIEPKTYTEDERSRLVAATSEDYAREWEAGKPGWHGFLERGIWREC